MLKSKHILFIDEFLKDSDHIRAYRIVYKCKDNKIASVAGKRLLKHPEIKKEVSIRQAEKEKTIQEARNEVLTDQAKEGLLSDLELEIILCDLAGGEIEIEDEVMENGKRKKIFRGASPIERISAIDKLFRKRGSNQPTKIDIKETGKLEITRTIINKSKS